MSSSLKIKSELMRENDKTPKGGRLKRRSEILNKKENGSKN